MMKSVANSLDNLLKMASLFFFFFSANFALAQANICIEDGGDAECSAYVLSEPTRYIGYVGGQRHYFFSDGDAASFIEDNYIQPICTNATSHGAIDCTYNRTDFPPYYQYFPTGDSNNPPPNPGPIIFGVLHSIVIEDAQCKYLEDGTPIWTLCPWYVANDWTCVICNSWGQFSTAYALYKTASCPEGYSAGNGHSDTFGDSYCIKPREAKCPTGGNPIAMSSGEKLQTEVLVPSADGETLQVIWNYGSHSASVPPLQQSLPEATKHYWTFNYEKAIVVYGNTGSRTVVTYRSGDMNRYFRETGGNFHEIGDSRFDLTPTLDNLGAVVSWKLSDGDKVETYSNLGYLQRVDYFASGNFELLQYDANARVSAVSNAQGRALSFEYKGDTGLLSKITDSNSQQWLVDYNDETYSLSAFTFPDLTKKKFGYGDPGGNNPTYLTSITDENNKLYASFGYDSQHKANHSAHAGGVEVVDLNYDGDDVTVQESLGNIATLHFSMESGVRRLKTTSSPTMSCGGDPAQSMSYNSAGLVSSKTDFNGNVKDFVYDSRGLLTQMTESGPAQNIVRSRDTTWDSVFRLPVEKKVRDASGTTEVIWKAKYNNRGQATVLCKVDPSNAGYVCAESSPAVVTVRRWFLSYCENADVSLPGSTCPVLGLLKSVNGPRPVSDIGMASGQDDTTTYAYYPTADETGCGAPGGSCHRKGDLWKVTNALGQVDETVAYDKVGRVVRSKDPNGTISDFSYNARGWVLSRSVRANASGMVDANNDATTAIAYDAAGNVTRVTQPDGTYLDYIYDDAHRLTDIVDKLSNRIKFTPDLAGNHTKVEVFDSTYSSSNPGQGLRRTLSRSFNELSRMTQVRNAGNQPVRDSTTFVDDGYDGNGNPVHFKNGLNVETVREYDPLNRLTKTIADYMGSDVGSQDASTQYSYDSLNSLLSVIDPNGIVTSYDYDGLHNLAELHSHDTGDTSYTYDASGNRKTRTDARGVTATYSYDALNRPSGVGYPDASLDIGYVYDQGDNATGCAGSYSVGRLTQIVDHSGSTTYCYDRRGNVVSKRQVAMGQNGGSAHMNVAYTYSVADRLQSVEYPSGLKVLYGLNALGQIANISYEYSPHTGGVVVGKFQSGSLVQNVSYYPFGPIHTISFDSGRTLTKTYDDNYQIESVVSSDPAGLVLAFQTDAMGNVTNVADALVSPTRSQHYLYDHASRLIEVDDQASTPLERFTYNKTGDRLSRTIGAQLSEIYTYASGTHRLSGVAGSPRSYDAAGNTVATAALSTLGYDDRNRLTTATQTGASGSTTFDYTGRGERSWKGSSDSDDNAVTYLYDERSHLLSEIQVTHNARWGEQGPNTDYVYLGGIPVAVVRFELQTHSGRFTTFSWLPTFHYLETDHLGTPRVVVDEGDPNAAPEWKWDFFGSAFGDHGVDEDPDVNSVTFTMNLRYAGQQFDANTGLHYNQFRDYDPYTARYVESDPIGLRGGLNTFAYAKGNALRFVDPLGTTQCDIDFAIHFAETNVTDQTIPSEDITSVDHIDPSKPGSDTMGQTEHGYDGSGVPLKDFKVTLSDEFLQPLDRFQLEDLLETIIHEGLHIDQPENMWSKGPDSEEKKQFHADLTKAAFNKMVPLRDLLKREHEICGCQ